MASQAQQAFSEADRAALVKAIELAELQTSGEVRLFVEDHCPAQDAYERALALFHELKMNETAERNGVLFYLAMVDHKFAILGDEGIHAKVPHGFWNAIRDRMRAHFREGRFVEGLREGMEAAGHELKTYFPRRDDDVNELSDEIIIR